MDYSVIRSDRYSYNIKVTADEIIVRAPRLASDSEIELVVSQHEKWILDTQNKMICQKAAAEQAGGPLTPDEVEALKQKARKEIPDRVRFFANLIGTTYSTVSVRMQKSRWGSCSNIGNLNFNCLLLLAPPKVLDSVIVHELCHRKEMNHSKRFYNEILRVMPDYQEWDQWLDEHGGELMARHPNG